MSALIVSSLLSLAFLQIHSSSLRLAAGELAKAVLFTLRPLRWGDLSMLYFLSLQWLGYDQHVRHPGDAFPFLSNVITVEMDWPDGHENCSVKLPIPVMSRKRWRAENESQTYIMKFKAGNIWEIWAKYSVVLSTSCITISWGNRCSTALFSCCWTWKFCILRERSQCQ